jgi:hypothetical protein
VRKFCSPGDQIAMLANTPAASSWPDKLVESVTACLEWACRGWRTSGLWGGGSGGAARVRFFPFVDAAGTTGKYVRFVVLAMGRVARTTLCAA